MFRLSVILGFLIVASCSSQPNTRTTDPIFNVPRTAADFIQPRPQANIGQSPTESTPPTATSAVPAQKIAPLTYHRTSRNGVTLSLVSFDSREHQLRVADQPKGLGTRWVDAKSAAATYGGLAAINGGFFTPEGKPLGLLIETGTKRGYVNKSSLGAGMYVSSKTNSSIIRREQYNTAPLARSAYNLLQTGPMLVEKGKPVPGLSKSNRRPRSFIAWDGKNHWTIGYTSACTLDQLAGALAGRSPAGFNIKTAVNLDGGRSSDLWVGSQVRGGEKTHRGFLNKPVRNYLVLIPR